MQKVGVGKAALQYALLPVGAVAGSYLAGWATDRFFSGRRAPVICILLLGLAGLALAYGALAEAGGPAIIGLLLSIGFCIYGPQVLLVGTAPSDLARRGTSAAAAGFVNFLGYMGAASGDVITGSLLKAYDWQIVIRVWAVWALTAAVAAALLWNRTSRLEPSSN
jgi:sugar phosphate permease